MRQIYPISTLLLILTTLTLVTGCLYRAERQQGNIIEKEQVAKIQLGYSKIQVERHLGIPLLFHPLDPNQWIYIYQIRLKNGDFFRQHVIVHFDRQDRVSQLEKHNLDAVSPSLKPKNLQE